MTTCRSPTGPGPGTRPRTPLHPPEGRRPCGFTLVELLLASATGALVLIAALHLTGVYAQALDLLTREDHREVDAAITAFGRQLRYAWWAEVTGDDSVLITDSDGGESTWSLDADRLVVTLDDGSSGVLASGLRSGAFTPTLQSRLRELPPAGVTTSWWSMPQPLEPAELIGLDGERRLGVAFMAPGAAPVDGDVPGVTEQLLSAALESWRLPVATAFDGGGRLVVQLYRAWSPARGCPQGPVLAQVQWPLSLLPVATPKPGISLPLPILGGLGDDDDDALDLDDLIHDCLPPAALVSLDLRNLDTAVEPGRAYVLVLRVEGSGLVLVRSHDVSSAKDSGCAVSEGPHEPFVPQKLRVPSSLSGQVIHTRTRRVDSVRSVQIELEPGEGAIGRGSFPVLNQTLSPESWLSVVPGEWPGDGGGAP